MRATHTLLAGALVLAACGEPASEPADAPAGVASTDGQAGAGPSATPMTLSETLVADVCRAGVGAVFGQPGSEVAVLNRAGGVITVGWRAPVDGGQLTAECRVEGDRVLWRPLDRPVAEENRWMDQPGDPVVTYSLEGSAVMISQSLPDGTTTTTAEGVTTEEEAR